jgi:putative PIN family toxin of toxin-antitoxin system
MLLVLDTNVLVSALLSPASTPARILAWVLSGDVQLCADARILTEYAEVLKRPEFRFNPEGVGEVLDFIWRESLHVQGVACPGVGPDPDDMAFVEVCLAGPAECVVTGNLKHYPPSIREHVRVLTPAEFVALYLKRNQ